MFLNPANEVTLIGRLGADPKLDKVGELDRTSFSLAVDRNYKDKKTQTYGTDWFYISAIGETAKRVSNLLKKGNLVIVKAGLRTYKKDNDKFTQTAIDLVDFKKMFESGKASSDAVPAASSAPAADLTPVEEVPF